MPTYRVVRGTHRRTDGTRAERGDTVEMTEEERSDFPAEKFTEVETIEAESVDDGADAAPTPSELADEPDVEVSEDIAPEPTELEEPEAAGDVPDPDGNYDLLSKMAKHFEGDEVNGSMAGEDIAAFLEDLSDTEVAHLKEEARAELAEE